ncbi:UNVERIFIED_CONTAM: protein ARABIDILLO 1 [Sesamum radiatum]|uniref:Protein ARABIDILLO 1 n=1 Tax=Sesamum radiatum TaxID=300843 RepID=A0AAW2KRA9_SESRA
MTDTTLSVLADRHEALECLQIGPDFCKRISSDAIKAIAICCPRLQKLRISGVHEVDADAINALAKHCQNLTDIGFIDCRKVDETAMSNDATFVSNNNHKGKVLLAVFTDILKGVANLFVDTPTTERNIFQHWRNSKKDKKLDDILNWLESMICSSLLRVSESKSAWKEVQERAATALATFVVIDDETANIDTGRAEAVMRDNGIRLLLNLAQSWREGLQSEAAKAIANLSVNAKVPKLWRRKEASEFLQILPGRLTDWLLKRLQEDCGTSLLVKSTSIEVASVGGVHALVMLARCCKVEGVQEQAARALANLAAHGDSNSNNAAVGQEAGALDALAALLALLMMVSSCSSTFLFKCLPWPSGEGCWCSLGLSVSEANSIAIGREGGVAPLITLAQSDAEDVHETAAGALWNLAFNPGNALRIVDEGGVPALVHLCSSSVSKMTRFMSALALAYMFDGSGAEIGRFVAMLRNPSPTLKSCAAFALLQFTIPGGRQAAHHVNLLQIAGAQRLLRVAAAAAGAPLEANIFARIVLRNLEQHQTEPHL